ncbi:ribonuclease III [Rhodocyclus tenuis]|uniref:ribonuclease III n=1 Tax=Rhodocyclus gracilis TaxID=2929842 RepID=UPI001298B322|nr:ribonuclease III [Rhodocyclus gracilis]MRD72847.1 ribonuclease III [Rhodocyclus gracilis]
MTARPIELALGYSFADGALLLKALTHRSHSSPHNERLEFIGDSILNCVIARRLFEQFPALPEGDLSRLRANLVRQETLHRLSQSLALGDSLRLGEGEARSGGRERPSILADAMEALFGAIWMDGGFDAADAVISRLYAPLLAAITPGQPNKDAKTRLQELLQGRRFSLPKYSLVGADGQAHAQHFVVACVIDELGVRTEGCGSSRRIAEQMAAERALERLKEHA